LKGRRLKLIPKQKEARSQNLEYTDIHILGLINGGLLGLVTQQLGDLD